MNRICNIFVIVDPTAEEHPAIEKAALLAQQFGARLELFICDTKAAREARYAARMREQPSEPYSIDARSMLEELAQPLRERGLQVTTDTECADPLHAGLIDRVARSSADLVVKDTHHHSLAKRTFITNTDWHLIRACPVPLLLTKQRAWAAVPKIAAAVDPGHASDKPALLDNRIVDYACAVARALGGEPHLVHAFVPVAILAAAAAASPSIGLTIRPSDLAAEENDKRAQLEVLANEFHVDPNNVHLEIGSPIEVLPRVAEELQADIVTMGAISRSSVKTAFIGSTAEAVLDHLPCDALIVKPPDFAAMLPF